MNRYKFYKASCFVRKTKDYFINQKLHINSTIQTVGRVVYTADSILLECMDQEGNIILNVQTADVPSNESYVYMFGTFSYFQDLCKNTFYNFDEHCDQFFVRLDMTIWHEISEEQARDIEKLLFQLC